MQRYLNEKLIFFTFILTKPDIFALKQCLYYVRKKNKRIRNIYVVLFLSFIFYHFFPILIFQWSKLIKLYIIY